MEKNKGIIIKEVQTICQVCKRPLDGRYVRRGDFIFLESECPECGASSVLASEYADDFIRWIEYRSVNVPPKHAITKGGEACPLNCGTCENHLMTACCVLIDVTQRCNQHCPWCFAVAEGGGDTTGDPPIEVIERMYHRLLELGEERPFNIQLSGGEPTVRDDLPEIIRMGRSKGFEYMQLNTNGRRLGEEEGYAKLLADAGLTTVFLQFDGMNDDIYIKMRGEALLDIKKMAIANCAKAGLPVTLVPTVVRSINLSDIGNMYRYLLDNVNVIKGIHFQPAGFFGRHPDDETDETERVTMFGLMREIESSTGGEIKCDDMVPISTGDPLCCFCSSFIIEHDGSIMPLVTDEQKQEGASCCCSVEPDPLDIIKKDRDYVLNKWTVSFGERPYENEENSLDDAIEWIRGHMFTVSGMAFMDITNLDAERLKRCRVQYFTEDEKLIPFCAYNSMYRIHA